MDWLKNLFGKKEEVTKTPIDELQAHEEETPVAESEATEEASSSEESPEEKIEV